MNIIIRLSGELSVKSTPVRKQFQTRLLRNIKDAFINHSIDVKIINKWSRIFVEILEPTDNNIEVCSSLLARIPGIQNFSYIEHECQPTLPDIVAEGVTFYKDKIGSQTFAVSAKRTGKHSFSSMDAQKQLGGELNQGRGLVNLSNPDFRISLEITDEHCLFYSHNHKGLGGLPLGTGGHIITLLSGGFDSAIAAWMLLKRGVTQDYLLCNMGGTAYERTVIHVAKVLSDQWSYGYAPKLYILDFENLSKVIKENGNSKYNQIVLKRMFYKVAEKLCKKRKATAINTGEAIGQVSSQTLVNLRAIEQSVTTPILRPLIAFNKEDIIHLSRIVGTYDISSKVQEFCSLTPQKPATACSVERAIEEENLRINDEILNETLATLKEIRLKNWISSEHRNEYLYTDQIIEDATIIDCRDIEEFEKSHLEGALHMEYFELLSQFKKLAKDKKYLIYCSAGMQSAIIAEKMQSSGYLAYSLKDGTKNQVFL